MKMKKKSNKIPFLATVSPAIIWLILFLVLPLLYIVGISFMKKGLYGGVIQTFDLTAYKTMFQSKYMKILLDSLWLSLKTTGLCLLFGYPFAYIISNTKKKWKPFCVLLIMLPFWINSLIRTYGWNSILREQGILNTLLMQLGIIKQPLQMLYTDGAALLGMVYALIPFTVLPLYSSIEKLDHSLLEAASDLGASNQEPIPDCEKLASRSGACDRAHRSYHRYYEAVYTGRKHRRYGIGGMSNEKEKDWIPPFGTVLCMSFLSVFIFADRCGRCIFL